MKIEHIVDIAVVGAGPAGLAAMTAALAAGARVALIDDNPAAGGQIWRGGQHAAPRMQAARASFGHANLVPLHATRVVAAPAPGRLLLETAGQSLGLRYGKLVLASGARERLLPFPGWTLPGVVGAGGLQALVKNGLDVRGSRVVLAGSGPLLLAAADTLHAAGADVRMIAEQAPLEELARFTWALRRYPAKLRQAMALRWRLRGVPYRWSSHVAAALGKERLRAVRLHGSSRPIKIECDWLGVGYGLLPNTELAAGLGCALREGAVAVDALMQTSEPCIYAAGEATGVGGVDKAWLEGSIAGLAAAGRLSEAGALAAKRTPQLAFAALLARHFALQPALLRLAQPDTLICRCEDVARNRLDRMHSWREAKLLTRCGMGPCQGRICGAACAAIYGWTDIGSRPPIQPARLGTLAEVE